MSKSSIKNLFDELLREKRGFKYVLSTKIILKKRINDNEHKCSTVYFNSLAKTLINRRYHLNDSCFMWCHVRLINPTNSHPGR